MGGRGSFGIGSGKNLSSGLSGIKSRAQNWFDDATKFERRQDERDNTDTKVQGLRRSATFISYLRDQIERDAFNSNYEITISQVDKIVDDLFEKAKRKKR